MKILAFVVVLVVVIVGAGFFVFNSTSPDDVMEVPEDGTTLRDDSESNGSNLLQVRPDSLPPVDDAVVGDEQIISDPLPPSETDSDNVVADPLGETTIISIEDTGFVPSNVSITIDSTVTFVNNGQGSHWPASDVHPTHEVLPDFDSKGKLATGETYQYTFRKSGVWNFHDHLVPKSTGTITVIDK